jgi:hypothetical protein
MHMIKEREFLTLDEVEEYTGIKKNSLYYYLRVLKIETVKFNLDKRAYISKVDADRIKEIKDTPWLAGKKPSEKAEKPSVLPKSVDGTKVPVKPLKTSVDDIPSHLPSGTVSSGRFARQCGIEYEDFKNYMRRGVSGEKFEVTKEPHPIREGYVLKFLTPAQQLAAREILRRHNKISMRADTFADMHRVPRDAFENHMTRGLGPGLIGMSTDMMAERDHVEYTKRGDEKFLTSNQQLAAIQFWKRHKLDYSQCDQQDCPCHTR